MNEDMNKDSQQKTIRFDADTPVEVSPPKTEIPHATDEDKSSAKQKKKKPKKKPEKKALIISIVAVVLVLAVVGAVFAGVVVAKNSPVSESTEKRNFPLTFAHEIDDVAVVGSTVFVASGSNFSYYDSNGEQKSEVKLSFSNPHFAVCNKYIMVYDAAGTQYKIYSEDELEYSGESVDSTQIIGAAINDEGNYVLATRPRTSSEYASYLNYYTRGSEKPLRWGCIDYIVSTALSPKSENILCCGINSEVFETYTDVYSLNVEEFAAGKIEDTLNIKYGTPVVFCNFVTDTEFVVDFRDERLTYSLDGDGKSQVIEYGDTLRFISGDTKGNTVVVTSPESDDEDYTITVYDKNNNIVFTKGFDKSINDVSINEGKVYVLTDESLIFINSKADSENKILEQYSVLRKNLVVNSKQAYTYSSNSLYKY